MPSDSLKLYLDLDAGTLIKRFNGGADVDQTPFVIPALTVGDQLPLSVQPLIRAGKINGRQSYSIVTGFTLKVAIGVLAGTPDCLQTSWTTDGNFLSGTLDLNQSGLTTKVTAGTPVYFTIKVNDREAYQQRLTDIRLPTVAAGAVVPTPAEDFFNKNEQDQRFLKRDSANGDILVLKSPGGIYGRILGVNDDGSARDDIITL